MTKIIFTDSVDLEHIRIICISKKADSGDRNTFYLIGIGNISLRFPRSLSLKLFIYTCM